jgi:glycosyltransferase involved in cell wall biosynthesis
MRIAFLGPATSHLSTWLQALHEAGVEVKLITCHPTSNFAADLPVVQLTSRLPRQLNVLLNVRGVRKAIAGERPDLVVAYYATSYGLLASLASDCPYVVVTAGSDINLTARMRPLLVPVVRYSLDRAAAVVCWSPTMKEAVLRLRVPERKLFVLPRGINLDRFTMAAPQSARNGVLNLICLRRFRRIFHHDTLIEACRLLTSRGVRVHLTLCGDGPERSTIEARIASAGLTDRVSLLGFSRHDGVPQILRQAQVYVALSETDGASASLFEAMSVGLYPVVSDIEANRQWIRDGVNGTLVRYDDPGAVAAAIERLWREPDLQQRVAARNQKIVRAKLDIRANTKKFVAFFERIAREGSFSC